MRIYIYPLFAGILALMLLCAGCGSGSPGREAASIAPEGIGTGGVGTNGDLDEGLTGDGDPVDPSLDPFETADWDIVSFSDPRTDTDPYDIIDGRVLIAFKNPPTLPLVDPNYFDVERPDTDPVYNQVTYNYAVTSTTEGQTMLSDPAIAAFIAAEDLDVYSEWPMVAGLAAVLPEGQSVADAVANWPNEYPNLIDAVDPDSVIIPYSYPTDPPNDARFMESWHLQPNVAGSIPNYLITKPFSADVAAAWATGHTGSTLFEKLTYIAVLDTGVDYGPTDLLSNSTPIGANVFTRSRSTYFRLRPGGIGYNGGGEPDYYWMYKNANNAQLLGHGTCIASVISAGINNAGMYQGYDGNVCGITSQLYFPVAMKFDFSTNDIKSSESIVYNALCVIGAVKRLPGFRAGEQYGLKVSSPYYNLEVANMSFGWRRSAQYVVKNNLANRLLDYTGYYILLVAAGGNEGTNQGHNWPACHSRVLGVAAHTDDGNRLQGSNGSNYQSYLDISAPGENLIVADMDGYFNASTPFGYTNAEYYTDFGRTSGAAGIVSAIAALYTSDNWSYPPSLIATMITYNANWDNGNFHSDAHYGRIDCSNLF